MFVLWGCSLLWLLDLRFIFSGFLWMWSARFSVMLSVLGWVVAHFDPNPKTAIWIWNFCYQIVVIMFASIYFYVVCTGLNGCPFWSRAKDGNLNMKFLLADYSDYGGFSLVLFCLYWFEWLPILIQSHRWQFEYELFVSIFLRIWLLQCTVILSILVCMVSHFDSEPRMAIWLWNG